MEAIAHDFVTFCVAVCRNLMGLGWQTFHPIALRHDDKVPSRIFRDIVAVDTILNRREARVARPFDLVELPTKTA